MFGAVDLAEGNRDLAGLDTFAISEVVHGLLSNVEALASGSIDSLDNDRLALVSQLPASAAKGGVPNDAVNATDVRELGKGTKGGVSCKKIA